MNNTNPKNTSDHLANERTFLAWVRTAIAMMGFGFILVKFSIFLKEISLVSEHNRFTHTQNGHSGLTGVLLVSAAVIVLVMSYINYLRIKKQISNNSYKGNNIMLLILTAMLISLSIFLIYYLLGSL
ncbi:YidH family protein [Chryseobacterium taichungense]|uniref:YidH family protein n=1 Tax=Chryseobacterium taichungense TaxID=295069 RepID=UPI0028A8ABE4|nr:DUF202 domain-containing protein [Chryseobacterium taichungense]